MKRLLFWALIALSLIVPGLLINQQTQTPISGLDVYFLDAGQGDAILIRSSSGQNILIDGGPDNLVLEKIGRLLPYKERMIDLAILTHPHADHLLGLIAALEKYQIPKILSTGINYQNSDYRYFQEIIGGKNTIIAEETEIKLSPNCSLKIIYPDENISGQDSKNINNSSIVSELICQKDKILLMGDAEVEVEKELLQSHADLQAEAIKLGHHGSKTASSPEFIEQVSPQTAIITVGEGNKYNLPSPETLDEMEKLGIKVIRTDLAGTIKMHLE